MNDVRSLKCHFITVEATLLPSFLKREGRQCCKYVSLLVCLYMHKTTKIKKYSLKKKKIFAIGLVVWSRT